jgi:ATP-dependent exoDNAse (exonuclease V) alpha subunit
VEKAAFTRADLVEIVGAQLPVDSERTPRELVEAAVDEVSLRLTAPRAAHQREGHERFTLDRILAEETAVLDLVDARDDRTLLWVKDDDTAALSPGQKRAVQNIGRSPWLIQPLSAPAGAGKTTSMRALVRAAHRRSDARVLLLAPTGKAVDIAVREGAGDEGLTIAKAVQLLRDNKLELGPHTLVIVDEAAMVGTDDLRQLLTATTRTGAKTVLVGDHHQLAPVKARGGMFAQLCADLPWTQHLSQLWRMRDPDERVASLALRHGGPASMRRAIGWYDTHDRLRCGDAITMAADALAAYKTDTAAGKDALLICDTTEMADVLNERIHNESLDAHASTVTGARGHRIGVGDLILTRRNDPTIDLHSPNGIAGQLDSVRNGNRWRVAAIDPAANRVSAERLEDGARTVFENEYLREHVSLGDAVTVHTAQGVTADTTHAVLGENTTRSLLYVAITRGRHTNTAYLYERTIGDSEYGHQESAGTHGTSRGSSRDAADIVRAILANHDPTPVTAHDSAAQTPAAALPDRVRSLLNRRTTAAHRRQATYETWRTEAQTHAQSMSRDRSPDTGIEL